MNGDAKAIPSGGLVTDKLCNARYTSIKTMITIGISVIGLVVACALGYILNGESNRNSKIENQDVKITDVRIEAAAVKSDLATIKEDLRDIKRILSGMNQEKK